MNCNSRYITVFPSTNSMYEGKPLSERNLVTPVTRITDLNFKLTEDDFTLSKSLNNINIGLGRANINGYYIETTQSLTIENATDGYIVIALVRGSDDNLLGDISILQSETQVYAGVDFTIMTQAEYDQHDPADILILGELADGELTESETSMLRIDGSIISVDKHFPDEGKTSLTNYLSQMRDKFVPRYGTSSIRTLTESEGEYTLGADDKLQFDPDNGAFIALDGDNTAAYRYDKIVIRTQNNDTITLGHQNGALVLSYNNTMITLDENITATASQLTMQLVGAQFLIKDGGTTVFSFDVDTHLCNTFSQNISTDKAVKADSVIVNDVKVLDSIQFSKSVSLVDGSYTTEDMETSLTVETDGDENETLVCSTDFSAARVFNAVYNDYAEFYEKEEEINVGDVVEINPETGKCRRAQEECSKLVVGVCSNNYGHILGGDQMSIAENLTKYVPVGVSGRVRVKVVGAVYPGELLCSAGSGYAMASLNPETGTLIGKALEENKTGTVLMQIMLG